VCSNRLRQRCLIHGCRNLPARVPKHAQAEVKAAFWAIFDDSDAEPSEAVVTHARQRAHAFADHYRRCSPAAVACTRDTLPELTTFLPLRVNTAAQDPPYQSGRADLRETRRRVKVIGRLPVTGVWAVQDRASRGWRGW
jgi:putative transposase